MHSEVHAQRNCLKFCSGYFPAQNTSEVPCEAWCARPLIIGFYSLVQFISISLYEIHTLNLLVIYCFPILSAFPRFRVLIIFSHSFHHSFSCSKQLPCPKISTVPSILKRTFIFWKLTSNMSPQSLESILYEVFYIIYIKRHFWCSWILVWGFLLSCSS